MDLGNKTLLITGGTGSFGRAVLRRMRGVFGEIRVFSRDEKKQDDMRHELQDPSVRYYIGDVRDRASVDAAMRGVDCVFSTAALKQVPSCEFFPMQALQTNAIGASNVIESAIASSVSKVVVVSTDKAVYPVSAMGVSKAMMEKLAIARGRELGKAAATTVCCTRHGNVMPSRGSVLPLFIDQILGGRPITLTDPNMTRFFMTIDDAVDLIVYAWEHGENGDLFVQKSPVATIGTLVEALLDLAFEGRERGKGGIRLLDGVSSKGELGRLVRVIGHRHAEKFYETLVSGEEMFKAIDLGDYYRIPADDRDLNYDCRQAVESLSCETASAYDSRTVKPLDVEGMKAMLRRLQLVRDSFGL